MEQCNTDSESSRTFLMFLGNEWCIAEALKILCKCSSAEVIIIHLDKTNN